jgi:hypothetical protein
MHSKIFRRVGSVLLAVGIIDCVATILWFTPAWPYLVPAAAIVAAAGVFLLWGDVRAALWVRMLAVFLLAGGVSTLIAAPLFQPLDLTITEIRLDPGDFAVGAALTVVILALMLWVIMELGRRTIQDAIASAGIRRWDMRLPAQAGTGVVVLAAFLLWFTLHGQTAELATSLAFQQLGPDYQYHLSWISTGSSGHGTSVRGVVTAWNHKEIKQVLLHWETH